MKKLVMLLLVGAMMVSLVACGEKTSVGDTNADVSGESIIESSEESKKD